MSLSDYLAKNYLTADKSTEKKGKKRKRKEVSTGLTIAEDDLTGWTTSDAHLRSGDDDATAVVSGQSAEFRKAKQNNWTTLGVPAPSNSDQAAADAILASAARETQAAQAASADDAPQVVETEDSSAVQMADGTHAGLQTKEQVASALARRAAVERAQLQKQTGAASAAQETIYRDASGRIINVALKRAEARRAAEETARKEKQAVEERQGDVQRTAATERKRELAEAKYMPVARGVDDTEMNEELKAQERWADPAAGFLTGKKKGKSATGKPLYKGGFAPNRYGIRPGYRWDGVDRGNGFEKRYFAARNQRENVKGLEYAWQMDE
ncbi:MAG: Pre-mRNA-splicing factor cwc26 [Bathelium mastoideum]|nr:MAG: Pre-mRNA-splicing factor cwc26 [Bathelium mastoideum]